jgi:flagellar basal-body rod protein FlgG
MIKGLYDAAAGMTARIVEQETVANNLANVNTTGYKAGRSLFKVTIQGRLLEDGRLGRGMKGGDDPAYLHADPTPGALVETRNPLDVAIAGRGFFALETGDRITYTRNGSFTLNEDLELVSSQGYRVLGEAGPIRIAGRNVTISESGAVTVDGTPAATLLLVDFDDPAQLKRNALGGFEPEMGAEPFPVTDVRVLQGRLESSNVDPVAEMIRMIELNRSFESCQKAIQAQDETLKLATSEIAR